MVTTPQAQPPKPPSPPIPPKVAAHDNPSDKPPEPPVPPLEAGSDVDTPYPDEHYDTPNNYSPETIADEQRKRSDAMGPPADEAKKKATKDEHEDAKSIAAKK